MMEYWNVGFEKEKPSFEPSFLKCPKHVKRGFE
jgi:hypothetical protein